MLHVSYIRRGGHRPAESRRSAPLHCVCRCAGILDTRRARLTVEEPLLHVSHIR